MRPVVILIFMFVACQGPKDQRAAPPRNVDPVKFARVLADLSLAESVANLNVSKVPGYRMDTVYAFNVLAGHGMSRADFDSSVAFYSRNPREYKLVYEKVLAVLDSMKRVK